MTALKKLSHWLTQPENYVYSFSRQDYYHRLVSPKDIEEMVQRLNNITKDQIPTSVRIKFNGLDFGTRLDYVLKSYNKPRYIIEHSHNDLINHSVFFYKEKIGKHRVVTQMHFVDSILFWGSYLFNNNLDNMQIRDIELVLKEKYLLDDNSAKLQNALICDDHKNMIELKNDIFTSISYISGDKKIIEDASSKIVQYKQLVKLMNSSEKKTIFDKL